jgi:RND family efflux transporter MFP subunit
MKRRLSWLLIVTVAGCGHGPAKPRRGAEERLPRLEYVKPRRGLLTRTLELTANVEAMKRVDLCARVPGVVEYLPDQIDIGRPVRAGEVLVRLAVPELEADKRLKEALLEQARKQEAQAREAREVAEKEVTEARKQEKRYTADLSYQKLKYERVSELVRKQAQDLQTEQEAQRQLQAAEAALEAAQAQIATREAKARAAAADLEVATHRIRVAEAEVARLTEQIAFATIRAPFDGVLTRRWVDPGATIKDPGATLLTVVQQDRVRVLIDVPQRDVPLLNARETNPNWDGEGDPVTVRVPALAEKVPHGEFKGSVVRVARALDPVTRTMRAEVELDNARGYLRPGTYGTAWVLLEQRADVLKIPASALVRRGEGKIEVFVLADAAGDPLQGTLKRRAVELGLDDGKEVEIRGGLTPDDLVVARGGGVLREGDRVVAVPVTEP